MMAVATLLYNVVDSSVGVVPVTTVDPEKDVLTDSWRESGLKGSLRSCAGNQEMK
jgi:hypothetical protein